MNTPSMKDVLLSNEKIKNFQENFPDIAEAVIETVEQAVSTIRAETEGKMKSMEERQNETARVKFNETLDKEIPGWKEICRTDPRWPVWLSEIHPYSGDTRLDLLRRAATKFDPKPVVKMLRDFIQANPSQPGSPWSGPGGGIPRGSPQANMISREFIKDYYRKKATGFFKYPGGEKEAWEIEGKINRALLEGRIE